jgi:hypothetical protein
MITEINADGLRNAMALLGDAQKARTVVQEKIDAVKRELGDVEARLGAAREELRNEEAKIAASGSHMPDEPSPVEGRIALLTRHQRILTTRRGLIEQQELKPADDQVRAAKEAIRRGWRLVGLQQTEDIRTRYREAAAMLRAAYAEYALWMWEFPSEADSRDFPRQHKCPTVSELAGFDLLINPILLGARERLEAAAPDLAARIRELRAEIDGCK